MFWKKKNTPAPPVAETAPAPDMSRPVQPGPTTPVAQTPVPPVAPKTAPAEKPAPLFSQQARRDATFIQKAFSERRLKLRSKGFDIDQTPFDDGLEDYVTADAEQAGKTLSEFRDFALPLTRAHQGQIMQDVWVLYELDGKRDGYFVDFGATNGTTMSNSLLLERQFGWTGIVAEPNPTFHDRLHETRKCHISTKCVHSRSGETMEFICATRPMFSSIKGARDGETLQGDEIDQVVPVDTLTLNDLLDEYDAPEKIDYISIDTEGSEYDILSAFDFSKRFVGLFTIEHNHKPVRDQIYAMMASHGYVRRFPELSRFDDWYIHESLLNR